MQLLAESGDYLVLSLNNSGELDLKLFRKDEADGIARLSAMTRIYPRDRGAPNLISYVSSQEPSRNDFWWVRE